LGHRLDGLQPYLEQAHSRIYEQGIGSRRVEIQLGLQVAASPLNSVDNLKLMRTTPGFKRRI
jgi:hypothetical protein